MPIDCSEPAGTLAAPAPAVYALRDTRLGDANLPQRSNPLAADARETALAARSRVLVLALVLVLTLLLLPLPLSLDMPSLSRDEKPARAAQAWVDPCSERRATCPDNRAVKDIVAGVSVDRRDPSVAVGW